MTAIGAALKMVESRQDEVDEELESRESDRVIAVLTCAGVMLDIGDEKNIVSGKSILMCER